MLLVLVNQNLEVFLMDFRRRSPHPLCSGVEVGGTVRVEGTCWQASVWVGWSSKEGVVMLMRADGLLRSVWLEEHSLQRFHFCLLQYLDVLLPVAPVGTLFGAVTWGSPATCITVPSTSVPGCSLL